MKQAVWVMCVSLSLAACGGDDGGADPVGGEAATWTQIWEDVIVGTGCNGNALCHAGETGGLDLTDKDAGYAALVGVAAKGTNLVPGMGTDCVDTGLTRVVPSNPADSLLMQKIEGPPPCGDVMPPVGMLTEEQVAMFRSWIAAGAKDD